MTKKLAPRSIRPETRSLTRRDALALGAAAATSVYLPGGLIRSARAQTAFDYYIGPSGSDSNPGTLAQPWAITALNTHQQDYAGKTVGLLDGTYGLVTLVGMPAGGGTGSRGTAQLIVEAGLGPTQKTVIKAVNPRQAIIDWQRSLTPAAPDAREGCSISTNGDDVTIDGLVFTNNNYVAFGMGVSSSSLGGNRVTLKNCLFKGQDFEKNNDEAPGHGSNACAVYSQGFDDFVVSNCRFQDGAASHDGDRYGFIEIYGFDFDPGFRSIVEFCSFIFPAGHGFNGLNFKNNENRFITVRNNYFDGSAVTGQNAGGGAWCIVINGGSIVDTSDVIDIHNNVFINLAVVKRGVILMEAEVGSKSSTVGTVNIYRNTIIGPYEGPGDGRSGAIAQIQGVASGNLPTQTNIYENLFHRVSGGSGDYGDMGHYLISKIGQSDRNMFSAATPIISYGPPGAVALVSGLSNWRSTTLGASPFVQRDTNSIQGQPIFAGGTEAAGYKLTAASPGFSLSQDGSQVGAWSGNPAQVGCDFTPDSGEETLAAQYPGDIGIASDPSVIWTEGFEESSVANLVALYSDVANQPGITLDASVPAASTGARSGKMLSDGSGANSTYLYKNLNGVGTGAEWYFRYYVKYEAGVAYGGHAAPWIGGYNPPLGFPFPHEGEKPVGDDRFHCAFVFLDGADVTDQADTYNYWMQMHGTGGSYFGNSMIRHPAILMPRNQWVCIEYHVRLNTNMASDAGALIEIWMDDVLVGSFSSAGPLGYWVVDHFCPVSSTDEECAPYDPGSGYIPVDLQFRSTSSLVLNYLWLQNFIDAPGVSASVYYDDVVIATRRIGKIVPP